MFKRITLSAVGGAGVSLALGFTMMGLIKGEFQAQEKPEALAFEINPRVDEPQIAPVVDKPEDLREIETPPAPPPIETVNSKMPTEPISTVDGARPVFKPPVLRRGTYSIAVSDTDAKPILRIEPNMPSRAERSGHCQMLFDVSAQGKPYNVTAVSCSQSLFRSASIKAVQKWNYRPKVQNRQAVSRSGVRTLITFQLADENGKIIPE